MLNGLYAALLVAATFASSPPVAQARVAHAWQTRALTVSQRAFHPACGRLALSFDDPATAGAIFPGGGNDAQSGQHASVPDGWAWAGNCTLHINRSRRWLGYPDFCEVVMHEAGNASGWGHETWQVAPSNVRYPVHTITKTVGRVNGRRVVVWGGVDRRCLP